MSDPKMTRTLGQDIAARRPLSIALIIFDRFMTVWFSFLGMAYLIGTPKLVGLASSTLAATCCAIFGLFMGMGRWDWPGLLTKRSKSNG